MAAKKGYDAVVKVFLIYYAQDDWCELLCWTAQKGYVIAVKTLITAGIDKNAADKDDWKPLRWATNENHSGVVEMLLKAGVKRDPVENHSGQTPLHWAAQMGIKR